MLQASPSLSSIVGLYEIGIDILLALLLDLFVRSL